MFKKPKLQGQIGNMAFIINGEKITKSFYAAGEFNEQTGQYSILNKDNEVVEYMDILGNFTNDTTEFAQCFNKYIDSKKDGGIELFNHNIKEYRTGLIDFPSKFLVDDEVFKLVKKEEKEKYKNYIFSSILDKLYYKHYYNKVIKLKSNKVKMLKRLQQEKENNLNKSM